MQVFFMGSIFLITYFLIIQGKFKRSIVAFSAGLVVLLLKLSPDLTIEEIGSYADFNTLAVLLGMMILVGVLKSTGFFEFSTAWIVKLSKGNMFRVYFFLLIACAALSSVLDNVTTILVFSPIVFLIADAIPTNPTPLIFSLLFAANIGGTATLLGDPPNLLIGSAAKISFIDFSSVTLLPTIIVMVVSLLYFRQRYGFIKKIPMEKMQGLMTIHPEKAITNQKLFKQSLLVFLFVIAGFLSQTVLGYEPSVIALCGAVAVLIFAGLDFQKISIEIDWETIFFFLGLFVLTKGLKEVGITDTMANILLSLQASPLILVLAVLWISGILGGIIGTVPITTVFIPIIQSLQDKIPNGFELWWALALGASLGGNLAISGAAANMVAIGLLESNTQKKVSFLSFMKEGAAITIIGLCISTTYLAIRWIML